MLESKSGEKPLWSKLYDILEERILSGYYPVGSNLDTEVEIVKEFGVSRITVKQAMDKLVSENLICRKRGVGTIVLERQDRISTSFSSSFENLKENGGKLRRKVEWVKHIKAPKEVYEFFGVKENCNILCVKRYGTTEDNEILAIHITYINPITCMDKNTNFEGSLYKEFEKYGYRINSVFEEVMASIATEEEKEEFKVKNKNIALVNRVRKGYDNNNNNIEYTISKYVGNGYKLCISIK